MPNIIEQQDLLKGLPDTRLAMLLQNPVADIPPFLVAAEAQRRQAIRQQFAGSENKESVVDSLTKQLAKIPENLQSAPQTPPMVPPTPEMQGVAALQQQQAIQQIAQQPQAMRRGGMVQRYQNGSLVKASPQRLKWVMENFDLPDEQAAQKFIMAHPEAGLGSELNFPADMSLVDRMAQSVAPAQKIDSEVDALATNPYTQAYASGYRGIGVLPGAQTEDEANTYREEQSRLKRQYQQYAASQQQPSEGETPDENLAQLEELYAYQEPSSWENAQKWFNMAGQFLDPSKTLGQSIVGAGQEFASSAAEQARAKRDAELELKKARLQYNIGKQKEEQDAIRAAQKAERDRTSMSAEKYADVLGRRLDSINRSLDEKNKQLAEPLLPADKVRLNNEISALVEKQQQVAGLLASLGELAYGPVPYDPYSLAGGFQR